MGPPSFLQADRAVPSGPVGPGKSLGRNFILLLAAVMYTLGMRRVRVIEFEVQVDGKLRPEPVRTTVGDLKKAGYPRDPKAIARVLARLIAVADIERIAYRIK